MDNATLIQQCLEGNPADAQSTFSDLMFARIAERIDDHRADTHASLYGQVDEDVEQIDELSRKTMSSYTQKAAGEMSDSHRTADMNHDDDDAQALYRRKAHQRRRGISMSTSKLAKD